MAVRLFLFVVLAETALIERLLLYCQGLGVEGSGRIEGREALASV
jgi:hypothetical protein